MHVYMGTSVGIRAHRTVAYIGTVVGFHEEERKWLVRNNILAKKGQPSRNVHVEVGFCQDSSLVPNP